MKLSNRLYYTVKPFIPYSARLQIRHWYTRRKLQTARAVWPVLPGSEKPPLDWPGWPEGKQFAVVLTHDIEGQVGVERCLQLMALEKKRGFRSSFNFIPEGEYRVSRSLREELSGNGFEVAIHDLRHDGKLYRSRSEFEANARRINQYLKEWNAVGFRAGFMLHNLEWLHDLDVDYDASTFDTDPFEPQPDGVGTIFPFWVPRPAGGANKAVAGAAAQEPAAGYVELPYTLAQDSTLFLLLGERNPNIWLRKLDWVAKNGGMVLVNTHPDYMTMPGEVGTPWQFPVDLYEQVLDHIRSRYAGAYWHALPREMAKYCAQFKPRRPSLPAPPPKRVCMITHSAYEGDIRVSRYAEALVQRGDQVEVFALRASPEMPREEVLHGVKVIRVQDRFNKQEQSKLSYLLRLLRFLVVSSWHVSKRHWHRRYDFVHAHNLPDFVVFAAWLPRLTGASVILDVHDIVPEFFTSKFRMPESSLLVLGLKRVERLSAAFATHVILANHLWLDRYVQRSARREKCSVFINYVDTDVFKALPRTRSGGKPIIIYPGDLQWHQGVDIAIRAFQKLRQRLPQSEFHIYGDGHMKPEMQQMAAKLGLNGSVRFFDPLPIRQIAGIMARADLGVVPKRADSFGNEAYSTKILEFMALGVPVVISSTKIDRYYFDDSVVRFFESGNENALAEALYETLTNEQARREMTARAFAYAQRHSWQHCKHEYLSLVDSLTSDGSLPDR